MGTGRVLGALALLELGACTAPAQDSDTATTAASVSRNKQSDLPSAAPTAGLLPGTTTWIVPATPNGLQPIQSWFSVAGLPDGNVYMSACDHTTNSALYRLNPADPRGGCRIKHGSKSFRLGDGGLHVTRHLR